MEKNTNRLTRVAIVGAGLAGLVLAKRLQGRAAVTIFEKSRGTGGRMATRYAGDYEFDHGAQFFTARSPEFKNFLEPFIESGLVASWQARFAEFDRDRIISRRQWDGGYPHYVAAPRMNALGKQLATGVDIRLDTRIALVERHGDSWRLYDDRSNPLGDYRWFISTAPAAQTAAIMPRCFAHYEAVAQTEMLGCDALMLGFRQPPALDWDAALVRNAAVSWMSVNSSKPGRPLPLTMVVHSTNAWAEAHKQDEVADVERQLMRELTMLLKQGVLRPDFHALHRWRYANIGTQSGQPALLDNDQCLAACGDWCLRGRVEAAFTSATALADRICV